MAEYQFGSIVDRDFRLTLQKLADEVNVHGKTIQDLVAEGQLTHEQYVQLIIRVNGMLKSGEVDKFDLSPSLRDEIDDINNKIDKGDISVHDINKNKGKIDQTFLTDELISMIAGTSDINAVPADNSLTTEKFADKSVTPEKVNFLTTGKNLFNGEYRNGYIGGPVGAAYFAESDGHRSTVIPIKNNTTYTISKTTSTRLRIGLTVSEPVHGTIVRLVYSNDDGNDDNQATITSDADTNYLIIQVTSGGVTDTPDFMQVEEGAARTDWETYGLKLTPEAKKYESIGVISNRVKDGRVYVGDFGGDGKSDRDTIQDAFDYANDNIVVFEPKQYKLNGTTVANASKVKGIEGQNALLKLMDVDVAALRFEGNKDEGGASPGWQINRQLAYTEFNPFIRNIQAASNGDMYIGEGIVAEGTSGLKIEGCYAFHLRNGMKIPGRNRNMIISNNNIWHNADNGIIFEKGSSLHQLNMTGNHVSYCKNDLFFDDADMHNIQIVGNDIESGQGYAYNNPESLIVFNLTNNIDTVYEAIIISGNSLQDHGANTAPLLKFNSEKDYGMQDFIIGHNQLANSLETFIYAKGLDRASINGNTVKGMIPNNSIELAGKNRYVSVTGNHLTKGVAWSAETTKTAFTGNTTNGFTLPDSNDGKILVANNI